MKAAWYERQGPALDVLVVGETDEPQPAAGEVRIRMAASGVNPGDVKKREDAFGLGMPFPRVIPHSDGAGTVDAVGEGASPEWIGRRVWCFGAQSYRPFGTAAEYAVVPLQRAVPLPESVPFEQGACLGIPGITAHRCVHVAGPVEGRTVLVQGGAGAVGAGGAPPRPPLPRPKPAGAGGTSGIFAVPPTFSARKWVLVANPMYCVSSTT